ncbi:MAG: polysaccharide deacetylase family protein [Candidatus Omnitrophica bacterium]|nr:polysaccharide deacetylase family protein [Candidatus Omnitrophota bacterium]MDD5672247.1 polysaccharide deacetylase family protein [Candidatus Omnitrophota bacterium]
MKIVRGGMLFLGVILICFAVAFIVLPLPGDIPVLMYHFVDTSERARTEKNVVSEKSFWRQMEFLHRFGYHAITLDEFYEIKMGIRKPRGKEVVLTFDDGNYTFADRAFPILKKFSLPSAVFAVSDNARLGINGSMSPETLKKLQASGLVTIGCHSKTHPNLSELSHGQILSELKDSKTELETMIGVPVYYLAYPSGNVDERVIQNAREAGYRLAFTTSHKKLNRLNEGLFALTRVKITSTADFPLAFWGQVSGLYGAFKSLRSQSCQTRQGQTMPS